MGRPGVHDKACTNCRYCHKAATLDPDADDATEYGGECRKRAPVIGTGQWADQDQAPWAYWPTVAAGHWCGDFQWSRASLPARVAALPDAPGQPKT
ncbi:MAG: hypothetical protein KAI41_06505 [Hyphomicrobiaceae bacterium]|nr:hypothetical protein [Hyphomicrobiaceae bacterium]MCK5550166.1 hypothetical protein [Hyphomicrobiaceae bacterium]